MSTRIVVLGGGFAGVSTAQELTRCFAAQGRLADGRGEARRPGSAPRPSARSR